MEVVEPCGLLIKKINDALQKKANNQLRADDLTLGQLQMLMTLNNKEDGISSLKELEKYHQIAQSTTVGIVKRLELKGLVDGYTDSKDKRMKLVKITTLGKEVCHNAQYNMNVTEQRLLHSLSKVESEQLKVLLQKVHKNFR